MVRDLRNGRTTYVPAKCDSCGKDFQRRLCQVRSGKRPCCSKACVRALGKIALVTAMIRHTPESTPAERRRAQGLINMRIRRGMMVRPGLCSQCAKPCKPMGHHDDYGKPDEVRWLCRSCHGKVHAKSRNELSQSDN